MKWLNIYKVRLMLIGFVVSGFLGRAEISLAANGAWMTKADMPTARAMLCAGVVEGKIYAIGGALGINSMLDVVEVYDPETDTWEQRSSMPTPRGAVAACVVDEIIYVFGGGQVSNLGTTTVFAYDPATDIWTSKADMPTSRQGAAACEVDGIAYVIGGLVQSTSPTAVVEAYDPKVDTWTQKTPMPSAAGVVSGTVVDGVIYVLGGGYAGGSGLRSVFAYDPQTDTWIRKADMPTARMGLSTCSVDGIIYAIGGTTYGGGPGLSTVEAYNPATDSWTIMMDMQTPRKYLTCSVVHGRLHVIGGVQSVPLATLEVYDLTPPPPDFNSDGVVDINDLVILIEYWGTDEPLCDIAPPPFGDGVVDALDLELLMSHWGQLVDDPTLIAHWALDEAEGIIAADSVSENNGYSDGYVMGDPVWQPTGGQVNGAIQLDGVDDYIIASPILNPAEGPFSVFAWIRGGAPGQVVLSQQGADNWLTADVDGNLMTELAGPGRNSGPLWSQTVITDGIWHRIGFVWDGIHRTLYVDGVVVAEETQANLEGSDNGLYIGTGKAMTPGTYFSGLIDDVRIYNIALILEQIAALAQ